MSFSINKSKLIRRLTQAKTQACATPVQKKYTLLGKSKKDSVSNLTADKFEYSQIPPNATTYQITTIGKSADSTYHQRITSFYDKENRLVKRVNVTSDNGNTAIKMKEHGYEELYAYKDGTKDTVRTITTREMVPQHADFFTTSIEEQTIIETKIRERKLRPKVTVKKLFTLKNTFNPDHPEKISAEFIEHPFNRNLELPSAKKLLGLEIEMKDGIPHFYRTNQTSNVEIPLDDEFLGFRFLAGSLKQERLTQHYLNQKKLGSIGIKIETNPNLVRDDANALFNPAEGAVQFKKIIRDASPAEVAAHEAEHAYQESMIGRFGKALRNRPRTQYEKNCQSKLGYLWDYPQKREAEKYKKAAEDLIDVMDENKDKKLENILKRRENLLEKKAREAGAKAEEIYSQGRNHYNQIFPLMPGEYNF